MNTEDAKMRFSNIEESLRKFDRDNASSLARALEALNKARADFQRLIDGD